MRCSLFPALVAAACLLFGCEIQPTPPAPAEAQSLPEHLQQLVDKHSVTDQAITDEAEQDPSGCLWPPVPDPAYSVYAVTFLWGHLLHDGMPPVPVLDWSGELRVTDAQAAVKVVQPIDFEEGEDRLLPVTEPAAAAWVSRTAGDFDGLGLLIRIPALPAIDSDAPALHFKTGPFAVSLPLAKLERLAAYYPVEDTEGVVVAARRLDGLACRRGFIKGQWIPKMEDGSSGSLCGMWYDLFGIPVGTMGGEYWRDDQGAGLFRGWLSGVHLTVVLAEFKGTWRYEDSLLCANCPGRQGFLEGVYQYQRAQRRGVMKGVFGDLTDSAVKRALPLAGTWRDECPILGEDPSGAAP